MPLNNGDQALRHACGVYVAERVAVAETGASGAAVLTLVRLPIRRGANPC